MGKGFTFALGMSSILGGVYSVHALPKSEIWDDIQPVGVKRPLQTKEILEKSNRLKIQLKDKEIQTEGSPRPKTREMGIINRNTVSLLQTLKDRKLESTETKLNKKKSRAEIRAARLKARFKALAEKRTLRKEVQAKRKMARLARRKARAELLAEKIKASKQAKVAKQISKLLRKKANIEKILEKKRPFMAKMAKDKVKKTTNKDYSDFKENVFISSLAQSLKSKKTKHVEKQQAIPNIHPTLTVIEGDKKNVVLNKEQNTSITHEERLSENTRISSPSSAEETPVTLINHASILRNSSEIPTNHEVALVEENLYPQPVIVPMAKTEASEEEFNLSDLDLQPALLESTQNWVDDLTSNPVFEDMEPEPIASSAVGLMDGLESEFETSTLTSKSPTIDSGASDFDFVRGALKPLEESIHKVGKTLGLKINSIYTDYDSDAKLFDQRKEQTEYLVLMVNNINLTLDSLMLIGQSQADSDTIFEAVRFRTLLEPMSELIKTAVAKLAILESKSAPSSASEVLLPTATSTIAEQETAEQTLPSDGLTPMVSRELASSAITGFETPTVTPTPSAPSIEDLSTAGKEEGAVATSTRDEISTSEEEKTPIPSSIVFAQNSLNLILTPLIPVLEAVSDQLEHIKFDSIDKIGPDILHEVEMTRIYYPFFRDNLYNISKDFAVAHSSSSNASLNQPKNFKSIFNDLRAKVTYSLGIELDPNKLSDGMLGFYIKAVNGSVSAFNARLNQLLDLLKTPQAKERISELNAAEILKSQAE